MYLYGCMPLYVNLAMPCYMFFLYAYCLQNKANSILEGALGPTLSCYGSVTYHINCAYAHSSIYWWALLPSGKLKECAPSHLYPTAQSLICTFVYLLVGFASFRQLERVCAFPPIPDSSIPVFPLVPHGPPPPIPDSSTPHVPVSLP